MEDISVNLGFDGEINNKTLCEGHKRMNALFDMEMIDAKENALAFNKARQAYHKSFEKLLQSIKPLEDDRFWDLLQHYRNEVIQYAMLYDRGTENAADEFFRKSTFGSMREVNWNFDEAMAFIVAYDLKVKSLYKPLFDVVEGRGDDGYSDLLDSLPLAGRETYEKCVTGKFFDNEEFEDFVKHSVQTIITKHNYNFPLDTNKVVIKFQNHILNGENYNRMMLREQAEKFFVHKVEDDQS